MAKRGPKGTDNKTKKNQGTYQPCRDREEVFSDGGDNDDLVCPDWLDDKAKEIWASKIGTYNAREQNVSGVGHALAQYCALESAIIKLYEGEDTPPMAMVNALRIFMSEFFDTPASKQQTSDSKKKSNPFAKHGMRVVK